jgi:alkaline phosphatase D
MLDRRQFLKMAAALGATLAWGCAHVGRRSTSGWRERRDLYPQGVASGDPDATSVLLWTRRPCADGRSEARLLVEVAEDPEFARVIATTTARVLAEADWTCRVLVGGLTPAREYWYRFVDANGDGSRIGRTLTAPADDDARPARFAFVSCQNICEGAQNAYRRMIWEDERAAPDERLGFVLHLGDFVYEIVQYPEDVKDGHRYDRTVHFPVRYPGGKKVVNRFHVPASLTDYRVLYHAYLQDPDLQDARARFPFVAMWDNHEFSWLGWQSIQEFGGEIVPAQTLKVAANQAWFEFQPARVAPPGRTLERFDAPHVVDTPIDQFDEHGLGREPNNLAAVDSLIAYRALRWGRHIDLIITDQHSFRSREPTSRPEAKAFGDGAFLDLFPEDVAMALDGGRDYAAGNPPATLTFGGREVANFCRDEPAQSMLGATQKAWFLQRLRAADATWKIWGNSLGTLDWRADPQHLPANVGTRWPGQGYACFGGGDWGTMYRERAEIYDEVRDAGITGFAIVSGDRHSFWAGLAAKALPPAAFEPVGVAFVTGSISAVGLVEAYEHSLKDHPLRELFIANPGGGPPQPTVNLLFQHGVRAALEYARTGDLDRAHAASNPELSPHLAFVDMGGHGYATVRVDADAMATEFVCIPRPIERSDGDDGGPLRYRVRHEVPLWRAGEVPQLRQMIVEGNAGLANQRGRR